MEVVVTHFRDNVSSKKVSLFFYPKLETFLAKYYPGPSNQTKTKTNVTNSNGKITTYLNPLVPNAPFLYLLKTSENCIVC